MKNLYKSLLVIFALVSLMTSCENEGFLYQDSPKVWLSGDAKQEATKDSVFYSFKIYSESVTEQDLYVIVNLTGEAADHDRTIGLEVVPEETNVAAADFTVGNAVLPKGAYSVKVPVTVKRKTTSIDISKEIAHVTFKVVDADELKAGVGDRQKYRVSWCDYLIKPSSWGIIEWYIGPFTQARFKFIIDYAGYTSFDDFDGDYNRIIGLQGLMNRLLKDYNSDPANEGRPEGWPYLNDNGEPLVYGEGLAY